MDGADSGSTPQNGKAYIQFGEHYSGDLPSLSSYVQLQRGSTKPLWYTLWHSQSVRLSGLVLAGYCRKWQRWNSDTVGPGRSLLH